MQPLDGNLEPPSSAPTASAREHVAANSRSTTASEDPLVVYVSK